jgi:hypothetical protein
MEPNRPLLVILSLHSHPLFSVATSAGEVTARTQINLDTWVDECEICTVCGGRGAPSLLFATEDSPLSCIL